MQFGLELLHTLALCIVDFFSKWGSKLQEFCYMTDKRTLQRIVRGTKELTGLLLPSHLSRISSVLSFAV